MTFAAHHRRLSGLGLTAVLLSGVSGCGKSEELKIPGSICGRDIEPALLQQLLPNGESFEAQQDSFIPVQERCVLSVDNNRVLFINEYRDQNHFDILKHFMEKRLDRNPEKSTAAENSAITDGEILAMTACTKRGKGKNHLLHISIMGSLEELKEKREELDRFAASYLPESRKEMGCTTT
ncbi:hypothetical protein JL475_30780 [Streptomyces sp. M2CJ-2]|uniref:hypothetical protein n=1 Tax=Streptomyces sp. M2CJ-2 TaxID=2803948 RepID=UPI001929758F|nr:hypothetical protein [Streptomyces sp. M2CJ-2]MBL3670284.1 hypothetical protein [Streptomyces sp. M2CJ-2]